MTRVTIRGKALLPVLAPIQELVDEAEDSATAAAASQTAAASSASSASTSATTATTQATAAAASAAAAAASAASIPDVPIPVADGGTGATTAAAAATALGVGTGDSPQFAGVNVGHATDTTVTRSSAGVLAVEGVILDSKIQQNSQSAAYTTVIGDANKHILHPTADNNARTFTIDSNANVAYPIGTTLTFVNQINTVTIAITSDTLTMAGSGSTGSRTLAANGIATALKIASTSWIINGVGLT